MSIRRVEYENGKKVWMIDVCVTMPDGSRERVRKVSPVQTKRGAQRFERELRHHLIEGTFSKGGNEEPIPTIEEFKSEFMDVYARPNNKPSEVRSKEYILRVHLVPEFGNRRLDAIGARDIERYKAKKLKEGLAKKTVNNQLTVLRRMLAVAAEWEIIDSVPHVNWLKTSPPEVDFLDFDEADALIANAEESIRSFVTLALRTGMRLGELLALRFEDVDLEVGRLMVRRSYHRGHVTTPKSGKSREIPLSDDAIEALCATKHRRGPIVFCTDEGDHMNRDMLKRPLWRSCEAAGLRKVGWHAMRHTFASHLVMKGVPLRTVQELLGHATVEMTMRYAHLSPDVKRDAVQLLDEPIDGT